MEHVPILPEIIPTTVNVLMDIFRKVLMRNVLSVIRLYVLLVPEIEIVVILVPIHPGIKLMDVSVMMGFTILEYLSVNNVILSVGIARIIRMNVLVVLILLETHLPQTVNVKLDTFKK